MIDVKTRIYHKILDLLHLNVTSRLKATPPNTLISLQTCSPMFTHEVTQLQVCSCASGSVAGTHTHTQSSSVCVQGVMLLVTCGSPCVMSLSGRPLRGRRPGRRGDSGFELHAGAERRGV